MIIIVSYLSLEFYKGKKDYRRIIDDLIMKQIAIFIRWCQVKS